MPNHSQAFRSKSFDRRSFTRSNTSDGNDNISARVTTGRKLELVSRSDFADAAAWENLPDMADPAVEAGNPGQNSSHASWSTVFNYLMEGFLLYGASLHPNSAFPTALLGTELSVDESPRRGFGPFAVPAANRGEAASRPERGLNPELPGNVTSAGAVHQPGELPAGLWTRWRREREIRKAISALEMFDDRSLRDMGIPSRSQIERVVRYCRDC